MKNVVSMSSQYSVRDSRIAEWYAVEDERGLTPTVFHTGMTIARAGSSKNDETTMR